MVSPEERLRDLVHELRQPLSSIEAIAYYPGDDSAGGQLEARQYMAQLQRLVADTNTMLERSGGRAPRASGRREIVSFFAGTLFYLRNFLAQFGSRARFASCTR